MATISKLDWDIIDARVRMVVQSRRLPNLSTGLLWLTLDQFFPSLQDDILETITDGSDDRGVDAIHIIDNDTYAEIYIFQAKYRESAKSTDRTVNDSEALKVSLFIEELFDKSSSLSSAGNLRLREAVLRIWSLHEQGVLCRYKLIFCSNDQGLSASASGILNSVCEKHQQVTFSAYGPRDLLRELGSQDDRREAGYLQIVSKEVFERTDGDIRGVIASIEAKSFVDLITGSDNQTVKRYLFDDNLRVFLGTNGGYNQAIIGTAASSDAHLFWYLNNGITITCKNYSYNKGHASPRIKVEDFQIVNGAQTSHSLIEASRLNPEALDNVVLNVRIYATDREDIAERVAVATNSQARIQSRDLRANHPILKKLELGLKEKGYFFERKRNMHIDQEPKRRIDALKLGQIILAYYLQEPDRAKGESDSIFDQRFPAIFHEGHDVDELSRLFELYRLVEEMREDHVSSQVGSIDQGGELQYLVYGHWFVLYAARLLLGQSKQPVPEGPQRKGLVLDAISLVARACSQHRSIAHYQMFRSAKLKERILAEFQGEQLEMFPS